MTNNEVKARLDELQVKFAKGKYWNHEPSSSNDPESVTNKQCTHHKIKCDIKTGSCGCNFFGKGIQCHGFALFMAYKVFGTYPNVRINGDDFSDTDRANGWELYMKGKCNGLTLEPGDIIRCYGHSVIVHYVEGENVYVGEVWGDPPSGTNYCMINWGNFNNSAKNTASELLKNATFVVKAPKTPETYTVTVTFEAEGGTCSFYQKEYTAGKPYGTLPTATKKRHDFVGWYTKPEGGGSKITETDEVRSDVHTLYAKWFDKTVTVTFDAQGGTCSVYQKDYTAGEEYGTLPTPTRTGYDFCGWYTDREDQL